MALAFTNLLEEASTTGGDPVTTAGSITTVAGRLYIVSVISSTTATVSGVTLPGTVTEAAVTAGEARGTTLVVSCWYGIPTVGGTGTVTVDFSGSTTGTVIIVDEITGHHATTPIVATNIEGTNDSEHGGGSTTPTFDLPNALASAGNAIYAVFGASTNTTFTAGTDYTPLGEGAHNSPTRTGATQYDIGPADLTVDATWGASSLWAAIGFEIAEAAGTPINKSLTNAAETDTAQALSFTKTIVKSVTPATSTETAQALAFTKTIRKTITPATESDAAQSISFSQAGDIEVTLTPAVESDAAQPLSLVKRITLTPATEGNSAQTLSVTHVHYRTIAPATETEEAQGLSFDQAGTQFKTLTAATEADEAITLNYVKPIRKTIVAATETDLATALSFVGGEEPPVSTRVYAPIVIGRF